MTNHDSLSSPVVVVDAQVESVVRPLIAQWLTTVGLTDAYENPLAYQGSVAFAPQFALQLGIDLNDPHAVQTALAAQIATYMEKHPIVLREEQQTLLGTRLRDELFGLSILEPLIQHPRVSEIMVNGPAQIFVERRGQLEHCAVAFESTEHLMRVIHRMLLPLGEQVDQRSPRCDVRLANGALLSVVIPPLFRKGFRFDEALYRRCLSHPHPWGGAAGPRCLRYTVWCGTDRVRITHTPHDRGVLVS